VENAREAAVEELLERYEDEYDLVPELRPDGARRESLMQAAQIEVGLRSVLLDGGFGAFTDTFEDLGRLRQLPGIAVQRLMADGYGFGAEGDWKTAVLLRAFKVMARGLSGGTSFMEDYVYHLGPGPAKTLGAHMLEICPSIASARPSCEIHPLSIGGREDPVRLVFTAPPGQALMVCLIDVGGRLRLVANQVDVVAPDEELPNLPVARAVWEPRPELSTAAEAWLMAGGSHHSVFTQSLKLEAIRDLAEIAGIELVVIDEDTTIPQFANELRWNRAYYHLARGL
jgi:L-arabinose isomerase